MQQLLMWTAIDAAAVVLLAWVMVVIRGYRHDRRGIERDLAAARDRLALALEGSQSAVWDWDVAKNEMFLSAGWTQMLGSAPRDTKVTSDSLLSLVHPDDLPRVRQAVRGAVSGASGAYCEEHRVRRADGGWLWILSRGKVVQRDAGGRALRLVGTNQDISDRKLAEFALREHDQRLRLALDTAVMASWEWDTAADRFAWQDPPERLLGASPDGRYPDLSDLIHPEDLVRYIRSQEQVVKSGQPCHGEYRLQLPGGRVPWVLVRGQPERDASGRVARVFGVVQDISESKQAGLALAASERQMRLLTDAVPAVISYADAGERLVLCNAMLARLLGRRAEDIVGRHLREVIGEEAYAVSRPHVLRALAGQEVRFERVQATPRGPIDLSMTYVPRHNERGAVEGFYALGTDITELKRLDRMKSEFVSTVSHELRTPLTSIRGSLGVLAGGIAGPLPEKARGFIEIAKNNCERLIRLINDILDIEKIESGKMVFDMKAIDLMEVVAQVVAANEGFAAQHGVQIRVAAAPPAAKVHADSDRLAQVLTNFVSNACKFSPAGSNVDIAVIRCGEQLRVAVSDRGPGIPDEFRARIFQKFSQADSSDMRQRGGTGLGLSIAKAIVEQLGGMIGFESAAGAGTTFFFDLPEWRAGAAAIEPVLSQRPRVLILEDDADVARLLQIMVRRAGCESDVAASAAEARAFVAARRYAAITLDLRLPDQDGLSLLRELRSNEGTAATPVIVVSAVAENEKLRIGGENLGVVDWLAKPIDEGRLRSTLRAAIGSAGRVRVLHVEDDADVHRIVATIAGDIAAFDAAASVAQARERLQSSEYDVVLLDLGLPDGSGWDLLPLIDRMVPRPRVVIFSAQDATDDMRASGTTFLVKSHTSEQQLVDAIEEAVGASGAG